MIRPRQLPKIRDQILRHLNDPAMPIRAHTGQENQAGLDLAGNHLRAAELFWATEDMTALAVHAGASLAAARWATADRPSGCGLIVWDGGVGQVDTRGVGIPVEACTWGPAEGGCMIGLWISRNRIAHEAATRGAELVVEEVPPLIPISSHVLPVTGEPVPLAEAPRGAPVPVLAALASAWLLMQQPTLVDRVSERPDKVTARRYGREGRELPGITIVNLRRQYVPDQAGGEDGDGKPGRRYRHRWVVSGHWRNQACGPGWSQRRRIWVPSHVKGPDGAPLLVTERVNVWRR